MKTQNRIISAAPSSPVRGSHVKNTDDLILAAALRKRGQDAIIVNADLAFEYSGALGGDVHIVLPVPQDMNGWALKYLRSPRPQRVVWDCGHAQLPIAEEVLRRGGVDEVHFCSTKTREFCGKAGAAAAREISSFASPGTRIIVTADDAAWAARNGGPVVEVSAYRVEPGADDDGTGRGAAFLAGYLAAQEEGAGLVECLQSAHITCAAYLASNQHLDALPNSEELSVWRTALPLAHPRTPLPRWLAKVAMLLIS